MTTPLSPPALPPNDARSLDPRHFSTFRALRHRNYRLYFGGQIVSLTGSWVQSTALTLLAYELTRQSSWAALVSAAQVLPTVLLGVYGGSLADRFPRRPLIFSTQAVFLVLAMVLTGMATFDVATQWGLLAIALLIGVVNAVDTPSRLAFVIDMVGREDLANAVALNSLIFNIARMVGPAITAPLLHAGGFSACFLVNGLTFVAVLIALACMHMPQNATLMHDEQPHSTLGETFHYLGERRGLVLLLVLGAALAFFGWPLLSLLPALSDKDLSAGRSGYTNMTSAVGGGALVGALIVATLGSEARRWLLISGVVLSVVSLAGLAKVPELHVAVVCCALSGGALILFFATGQAMLQLGAGEHNRGRMMGIWLMVLSAAQPAGNLVAGTLADAWGVPRVLGLQALGIAIAAAVVGTMALTRRR
jgi:MFS family permease